MPEAVAARSEMMSVFGHSRLGATQCKVELASRDANVAFMLQQARRRPGLEPGRCGLIVIASEAKQSMTPQGSMDCFVAEPVIGRALARPIGSSQ
jgi:hypothetical protein